MEAERALVAEDEVLPDEVHPDGAEEEEEEEMVSRSIEKIDSSY